MRKIILALGICSLAATPQKCNRKKCIEKTETNCMCTMIYDPVCGCNQKTYSNACEAECHGIVTYVKGECPEAGNE